jgi:tryptophan-rich sensory protein
MSSNSEWYKNLKKSKLTPPGWVFGVVWPILYASILAYYIVMILDKRCINFCLPLIIFTIQMIFNLTWSYVFFVRQLPLQALIMNIIMIVLTSITVYLTLIEGTSYYVIILPYLAWISFASYLNGYIVYYN